jgi:hypothetical protein
LWANQRWDFFLTGNRPCDNFPTKMGEWRLAHTKVKAGLHRRLMLEERQRE